MTFSFLSKIFRYVRSIKFSIVVINVITLVATSSFVIYYMQINDSNIIRKNTSNFISAINKDVSNNIRDEFLNIEKLIKTNYYIFKEPGLNLLPFPDKVLTKQLLENIKNNPFIRGMYFGYQDMYFGGLSLRSEKNTYKIKDPQKNLPVETFQGWRIVTEDGPLKERMEKYYYLDKDFNVVDHEEKKSEYFATKRPWYVTSNEEKIHWTDVYVFSGSVIEPGITATMPMVDHNGEQIGFFCVDLSLIDLKNMVSQSKTIPATRVYLIDQKGQIISSSEDMNMKKTNTGEFQLPTIKELGFEYMENVLKTYSEECKSDQIILDQNDRLNVQINHLEIGDGKLYVVSITPDSEVLKETYQSQQKILMNCFMIIIMIIILMYLYAKRISKVITFLSVRAEKISELEFEKEEKIPRSSIIELQHLVNTMETMNRSMDNFSRYVPKDLVSKLVKDQEQKGLHVQEADISLFFSDIEGFTTVSEEIEPSVLIKQLTEYFTIIMEVLNKNSGTVDKFIGDAVMAFWGAPEKCENHPFLACYSALKIQERLFQKNKEWEADRMRPFYTRIGLHTGQALVGNIGSETRYNYTAIGDNVNLAARLEGLNKYYGTYLMISGSIYESVRSDFIVRPLGKVSVKGKSRLVDIYELIGAQGHVDSSLLLSHKKLEDIKLYTLAYETIERKEFDAALTFLDHIVEKDKPVQMLINICREWKEKDLSTNPWQGVVRHMEGK